MSIRHSILALLDQGASYGYQLRAEFEQRTGSSRPLNVGQVYNTLDRLERDGMVVKGGTDSAGHVFYSITERGQRDVAAWLVSIVPRSTSARDELAIKIAMAVTMPRVDVDGIIRAHRISTASALEELIQARDGVDEPRSADELARLLVLDSMVLQTEAELQWLDHSEVRLERAARAGIEATARHASPPKRGRPARIVS